MRHLSLSSICVLLCSMGCVSAPTYVAPGDSESIAIEPLSIPTVSSESPQNTYMRAVEREPDVKKSEVPQCSVFDAYGSAYDDGVKAEQEKTVEKVKQGIAEGWQSMYEAVREYYSIRCTIQGCGVALPAADDMVDLAAQKLQKLHWGSR